MLRLGILQLGGRLIACLYSYKDERRSEFMAKSILEDKKGSLIVGIMVAFIAIVFMSAIIPGLVDVINNAKSFSDGLNCKDANDYNATINPNGSGGEESAVGCLALDLAIPFLILGVIFGVIMMILYGRGEQPMAQSQYGGY